MHDAYGPGGDKNQYSLSIKMHPSIFMVVYAPNLERIIQFGKFVSLPISIYRGMHQQNFSTCAMPDSIRIRIQYCISMRYEFVYQ